MDNIQWLNNKETVSPKILRQTIQDIVVNSEWIIDGNYSDTLPLRLQRATIVIWLKEHRTKCIYRVFKRFFLSLFKNSTIGGNPKTISFEFIKYIWEFPKNNFAIIEECHQQTKHRVTWVIGNSSFVISELEKR